MKVWITKYALTQGILEKEAERCDQVSNDMIEVKKFGCFHGEGREWHLTKEEAVKRADATRIKKIVSLKKQIDQLENTKFE